MAITCSIALLVILILLIIRTIFDALFNTYWAAAVPVASINSVVLFNVSVLNLYLDAGLSQTLMLLKLRLGVKSIWDYWCLS
jgi:hypothetical protein